MTSDDAPRKDRNHPRSRLLSPHTSCALSVPWAKLTEHSRVRPKLLRTGAVSAYDFPVTGSSIRRKPIFFNILEYLSDTGRPDKRAW
jgi:hypothetical protein